MRPGRRRYRRRSSVGTTHSGWRWWSLSMLMMITSCMAMIQLVDTSSYMMPICSTSRICFTAHKVCRHWKLVILRRSGTHHRPSFIVCPSVLVTLDACLRQYCLCDISAFSAVEMHCIILHYRYKFLILFYSPDLFAVHCQKRQEV